MASVEVELVCMRGLPADDPINGGLCLLNNVLGDKGLFLYQRSFCLSEVCGTINQAQHKGLPKNEVPNGLIHKTGQHHIKQCKRILELSKLTTSETDGRSQFSNIQDSP